MRTYTRPVASMDGPLCFKGPEGRVLAGRHRDTCGSLDRCPGCAPCPEHHCLLCHRAHVAVVCPVCLGSARRNLTAIVELSGGLEDEMLEGRRSVMARSMPGGDALVLQAPAASPEGYEAAARYRRAVGLDLSHTLEESRADPTPPAAVLAHWEDRWRVTFTQPASKPSTLERSAEYLDARLSEACADVAFVPFARALASVVRQLEDVLLAGDRPERSRVPCWECGARLVKVYADTAAADHWTCPRCGEQYDRGRYDRAKHDHLWSEGADRFVLISDAAAAIGRSERSVRTWIGRGVASTSRDPQSGRLIVWWPDVRAANEAARTRSRKANQ